MLVVSDSKSLWQICQKNLQNLILSWGETIGNRVIGFFVLIAKKD